MMSVLQVMHVMYIRDIPNMHNAFIIYKALPIHINNKEGQRHE
jgi:hypothetical protein